MVQVDIFLQFVAQGLWEHLLQPLQPLWSFLLLFLLELIFEMVPYFVLNTHFDCVLRHVRIYLDHRAPSSQPNLLVVSFLIIQVFHNDAN